MRDQKIAIPETFLVTSKLDLANFKNAIVLAPPLLYQLLGLKNLEKFPPAMQVVGWQSGA